MPVLEERALPLRALPVLGERERLASAGGEDQCARLASAGGEGAPCQCWGRGRALPVLEERAPVPCQCWWRGRALTVLWKRARLDSAVGEGAP